MLDSGTFRGDVSLLVERTTGLRPEDMAMAEGGKAMKHYLIGSLIVVSVAFAGIATAQETNVKWLLGVWEGQSQAGVYQPTQVQLEFREEKGEVRYESYLTSPYASVHGSKARGLAKVSGDTVTCEGEYFEGRMRGRTSYTMTRNGDRLEGTGVGATNIPFSIWLKKVKQ